MNRIPTVNSCPTRIAVLLAAAVVVAQMGTALPAAEVIRVDQTFVPARQPDVWPGGREADWVPIERDRLTELLHDINRPTSDAGNVPFDRGVYSARFDPATLRLVDGTALLTFAPPNAVPLNRFIEVGPLSVDVSAARWSDEAAPAVLLGTDHLGRQQLFVPDKVKSLEFEWLVLGRQRVTGIEFPVALPPAVVSTLSLTVPAGWKVVSDIGVVTERSAANETVVDIELGIQRSCRLRLVESGSQSSESSAGAMTCSILARFVIRTGRVGGECDATFQQVPPGATQLTLLLPADVDVESVQQPAAGRVDWRIDDALAGQWQRLIIPLTDMSSGDRTYVIRYGREVPANGFAKLRSPRVEDAVLLDGRLAVSVEGPDRIQSYAPTGLRQRSVSFDDDVHQISFDQIQSATEVDVRISPAGRQRRQGLNVREVAVLDLVADPPELTAELALTPQSAGVYSMESLVPRGCEITSVEHAADADPVRLTWAVLPGTASHEKLIVSLPDGFPETGIRLRIRGQYPDVSLAGLAVPAILPDGIRIADVAFAVLTGDARRTSADQLAGLDVLIGSQLDEHVGWSTVLGPLFRGTRNRWQASYRNQPGALTSVRFRVAPLIDPDPGAPGPAVDNSENADGEPVRTQLDDDADVAGNPGRFGTPVVLTSLRSQMNPGSSSRSHHVISWRFLYPSANRTFSFELPASSHVLSLKWNDESLGLASDSDRSIGIPEAQPGDTLSIEYTLASPQVAVLGPMNFAVPRADVLSVGFECLLRTPLEFEVLSADNDAFSVDRSTEGLQWLFGPLARDREDWPFNPLNGEDWRSAGGLTAVAETSPGSDVALDWHVVRLAGGDTPNVLRVRVGHRQRLRALAWFTLAASVLIGLLLRATEFPQRNRIGLVLVVAGGAMASLLPLPLAEVVGAAVLGTCLATLIPRGLVRGPYVERDSMPSTVSLQRIPAAILCGVLVWASQSDAQIAEPVELPESISILIPYEGDGFRAENISRVVYIRSASLNTLTAAAREARRDTPVSLIRSVDWSGAVDETARASLTLSLDVSVVADVTDTIEVPFPASLVPIGDAIRIDGKPASFLLSPDGRKIRIDLPQASAAGDAPMDSASDASVAPLTPGWTQHRVELDLRPRTETEIEGRQLTIPAVAVPRTRIAIEFASRPAVLTSRGRELLWGLNDEQKLNVAIGPDAELVLNWADRVLAASDRPQPAVEVQSFVELHDGWLARRTLFTYEPGDTPAHSIAWRLPRGTRISRQQIRSQHLAGVDIRESSTGVLITGELDPPATEAFSVVMDWRQFPASAADRRSLEWPIPVVPGQPQMEIEPRRHVAGLTTESGLDLAPVLVDAAEQFTTSIDEYLDQWPVSEQPRRPRLALRVDSAAVLEPAIVSVPVQRQVRQSLSARVARRVIEWTVSAEVDTTHGRAFLHRFQVPAAVEVEAVSVQEEGVDRLSHWDQQGDTLFLHLRDQTTGIQNIVIEGRQNVPPGQEFAIPQIRVPDADGETVELTLLVHREPDVMPSISIPDDTVEAEDLAAAGQFFVQRYSLTVEAAARATITVEPLDTPPSLWSIARLVHDESRIGVELAMRIDAMQLPQVVISFADWPFDGIPEVTVTGGDKDASVVFDPESSAIQLNLTRSPPADLGLTMTAWFLPVAEDASLELSPPDCDALFTAASLISTDDCPLRLPGGEPPAADTLLMAQSYSLLDAETSDAFLVWREDDRFVSTAQAQPLQAPRPLVVHLIRSGLRDARVAATQILLQPTEDRDVLIQWPRGVRPLAVYRNGRPTAFGLAQPTDDEAGLSLRGGTVTRIPIPADGVPSLVEALWEHADSERMLKVQRHNLRLPRVSPSSADRTFLLAAPPAGIDAVEVETVDTDAANGRFRGALADWLPFLGESVAQPGRVGNRAMLALWQIGQSLSRDEDDAVGQFLAAMPASAQATGVTDLTSGMLPDNHSRLLLNPDSSQVAGLWLVDSRVHQVLVHAMIVLFAVPIVGLLFRIATFEVLAGRPEFSWLALGLVWWTCLAGSGIGFAITAVTIVCVTVRRLRAPTPVPAL